MGDEDVCRRTKITIVYGWGENDASYTVKTSHKLGQKVEKCPYHVRWLSMIERGYSLNKKSKEPSTLLSSVNEEWKRFTSFKEWMETQIWEDCVLDKDILIPGNKEYSSKACAFVPSYVNLVLHTKAPVTSKLPLGVARYSVNTYGARISRGRRYLGSYKSPEAAHKAWQEAKADTIEATILDYMLHPSYRQDVANALYLRAERLRLDAEQGRQTLSL